MCYIEIRKRETKGTAIKQNPIAPIIPTHRILAASATGKQAKIMRALQTLEQRHAQ